MTLVSLLVDVILAASSITANATIRGYVFGSSLKPDFRWTDVDVLIVCDDAADVPAVRPALAAVCEVAPIDLLVMSTTEERELKFVSGQGCKPLFELSAEASLITSLWPDSIKANLLLLLLANRSASHLGITPALSVSTIRLR